MSWMAVLRGARLQAGLVMLVALTAGCGKEAAPQLPSTLVSGLVTLDGEPVVAAEVRFVPQLGTKGFGGMAVTNSRGQYMIENTAAPGAVGLPEGKYKIVIRTFQPPEDPTLAAKFGNPGGKPTPVPPIYGHEDKTPLEAIVSLGGGALDFALKKKS